MAKSEKTVRVREHPRVVPISKKNPRGITIVDEHPRRVPGTYLDVFETISIFRKRTTQNFVRPTAAKLPDYKKSDTYDEPIGFWVNYFNEKLSPGNSLDPDVIKALIASESSFMAHNPKNKKATGITQITRQTWKIVQDPKGEAKDFTFSKVRLKDLKDPRIAIPIGVRWIYHKKKLAAGKLGREPSHEEIILEYKGLLKSNTEYKNRALSSYRDAYAKLKSK